MILWLILAFVTLASALSVAVVNVNREVSRATKAAMDQHGIGGCSLTLIWMTSGLVVAVLWTVYAYQVKDWRFAAIVWVPIVFRWISQVAEKVKVRTRATH